VRVNPKVNAEEEEAVLASRDREEKTLPRKSLLRR
jgi:hypothetical protein